MDRTKTGRYIAYLLRHRPDAAGLTLDEHGWAKTEDLLAVTALTMEELEKIVRTDEKQFQTRMHCRNLAVRYGRLRILRTMGEINQSSRRTSTVIT